MASNGTPSPRRCRPRRSTCRPKVENFCWRIEQAHLREGGFALIHGDPGTGKSVVMRLLAERLSRLADLSVGVIHHPQSNLTDFYRELGDIFAISIRVSNRWGGFKALRARWLDHLGSASRRPVVLIDEAQEMTPMVLSELRLLASARFDSQSLLCVVLSGDARLLDKLRREELIPLGSRIRTRLATGVATREELLACLEHLLATAGNAGLMTKQLRHTLCDHAAGNYRILIGMAAELLMSGGAARNHRARRKALPPGLRPAGDPSSAPRCRGPLTWPTKPIRSSSPNCPTRPWPPSISCSRTSTTASKIITSLKCTAGTTHSMSPSLPRSMPRRRSTIRRSEPRK